MVVARPRPWIQLLPRSLCLKPPCVRMSMNCAVRPGPSGACAGVLARCRAVVGVEPDRVLRRVNPEARALNMRARLWSWAALLDNITGLNRGSGKRREEGREDVLPSKAHAPGPALVGQLLRQPLAGERVVLAYRLAARLGVQVAVLRARTGNMREAVHACMRVRTAGAAGSRACAAEGKDRAHVRTGHATSVYTSRVGERGPSCKSAVS